MEINRCIKESFTVIGKEGSTTAGAGFIQSLWEDANGHFNEVAHLAKKMIKGTLLEYGERCQICHVLFNHGKMVSLKGCTWLE